MLSFARSNATTPFLSSTHCRTYFSTSPRRPCHLRRRLHQRKKPIVAATRLPFSRPPPAPPGQVYQPFRPPPSPLPQRFRSLNITERLRVLQDRLGLWHEFAPLISSLIRDGFTPSSIEETTGLSGVDQNLFIVALQVRESLLPPSSFPAELLSAFDSDGAAALLYELRLLNATQRAASAVYVLNNGLDVKGAQEVARAMKDFSLRRNEVGWEDFAADSPGDCLAFAQLRLSREALDDEAERTGWLQKALEVVDTEPARERISKEIERSKDGKRDEEDDEKIRATIPVVRLRYGEVAEASSVVLVPVVKELEGAKGVNDAPSKCGVEGDLGVVVAEKGWARWALLPGWATLMEAAEMAVAVEMEDGRKLPWRAAMAMEEKMLVVVDRRKKVLDEGEEGGIYLVERDGKVGVEKAKKLVEEGSREVMGEVVLVVRPPREDTDGLLSDEDWD